MNDTRNAITRIMIIACIMSAGMYFRHKRTTKKYGTRMKQNTVAPPITVWIHGTSPKALFPWPLSKFVVEKTHSFLHCQPGLHMAKGLPEEYHHYKIAQTLCTVAPKKFDINTFYLFGWSGDLNPHVRQKAADELYTSLVQITDDYEKVYGFAPHIQIITHSHGGNVALNLVPIHKEQQKKLAIDELILLACPVQETTQEFAQDALFKKIYSVHSHVDMIQVLDIQGIPIIK